jgi:hypothetical protein
MTHPRPEYHVTVQRKNTGRYDGKQNYEQYVILPAALRREQGTETGQILKIRKGEGRTLTLSRVNCKPVKQKVTYQEWLQTIKPFIPAKPFGKCPFQICREAGVHLATCPAIWVRQAEADRELERFFDPLSHRTLWARPALTQQQTGTMQKLKSRINRS